MSVEPATPRWLSVEVGSADRPTRDRLPLSWRPRRRRLVVGLGIAAIGPLLVTAALLPARTHVEGAVFGLALLVPTVVGAAVGGPVAAAVAVVTGSLTHNLFFTQPYLTLRVADTTDVVGLVVHTLAAIAVSAVVVREQRAASLAAHRGEQAARLGALEEVDRIRTALLGAVSHDLRTPLSVIRAAASDLSATDVTFSERDRSVLAGSIVEQALRLDRTVANLLDAGRLHGNAVTVHREAVEVEDVVGEALTEQDSGRTRVRLRIAPETPPVLVDPMLIVAALRNLVDNALRFGPAGTPVDVIADGAGDTVVVTIRDRGPGLSGTDHADLFTPFHSSSQGRVGLGLAIARGFIEAHDGLLRAHDADDADGGAIFEVVLPAAAEPGP